MRSRWSDDHGSGPRAGFEPRAGRVGVNAAMTTGDTDGPVVRATAPGRVNLIGDHTDYMGGLALPMTIPMATRITGRRIPGVISLSSDQEPDRLHMTLPVTDPASTRPSWGRYVAGVAHVGGATTGFDGGITSDIPVGAGLSSSAALGVAAALALGLEDDPLQLARLCQRAENTATGVPSGIMDQLVITASLPGTATLIDFTTMELEAVVIPESFCFWVVDSGQRRTLDGSEYASRRHDCEMAADLIGPLPTADHDVIEGLEDPVLRARARHVRSECDRVRSFADALGDGDIVAAGESMTESHVSLRDDFDVSTDIVERTVGKLASTSGVHGARMTGAGFGGCVVALTDPGIDLPGWKVVPSGPATVEIS